MLESPGNPVFSGLFASSAGLISDSPERLAHTQNAPNRHFVQDICRITKLGTPKDVSVNAPHHPGDDVGARVLPGGRRWDDDAVFSVFGSY